ncbi:MAG: sodium-dependent transporter [Sphingomonadales bacterium]
MSKIHRHESWTSRLSYIVVAIGATVGLGNLWRFPFEAGNNGGGVFILIYLFAVFFLVSPLFMAETVIGRLGRQSAPNSFKNLALKYARTANWKYLGFLGLFISVLVLSFFSVITSLSFGYVFKILSGTFVTGSPEMIAKDFAAFKGNVWGLTGWHTIVALITGLVVGLGIRNGIERVGKILMPVLFILLVFLAGYAAYIGDFGAAFSYMFTFNPEALTKEVALAAFGQAFFTMSVGSCGMLTYAAYVGKPIRIGHTTATIALGDTLVALLAGFAIFPLVFGFGLNPAEGAGLVFVTLPIAFSQMAMGTLVALAFYLLFIFAALTTTIALLETVVSYFVEKTEYSRRVIGLGLAGLFWFVGLASVLSFNVWSEYHPLGFLGPVFDLHPFGLINGFVGNILLPISGILISLFAGWIIPWQASEEELGFGKKFLFQTWLVVVRFIAPIGVLILLLVNLF